MHRVLVLASAVVAARAIGDAPLDVALNRWPMMYAHDAATGYLDPSGPVSGLVSDWTQTQSVGLAGQLDCGARAFDYRPYCKDDGEIVAHHGPVVVDHALNDSITEVTAWAASHPTELVLLLLSDASSPSTARAEDCMSAAETLLASRGVAVETAAFLQAGATLGDAMDAAALPGGGLVLALVDSVVSYYDSTITCYVHDDGSAREEVCYKGDPEPWARMAEYLGSFRDVQPPEDGRLFSIQALWQEEADGVVTGTLRASSLLEDEERSGLNGKLLSYVANGTFAAVSLFETNNMCDGGTELAAAIAEHYAPQP